MATRKSWRDRFTRIASMSADELRDRVCQQMHARLDAWRYQNAPPEILMRDMASGRKPVFFFSAEELPQFCTALRQRLPKEASEILARADRICQHRFDLLGYADLNYGEVIDWHLDAVHQKRAPRKPFYQVRYLDFGECGDVKVTWELNRHQHLVTLAKAFHLSGDEKHLAELRAQWGHWHRENPYPSGVNWASSLEVAFRSLSWLWAGFLLQATPVWSQSFQAEWIESLGLSARHISRYLSTYFSPNTHLLGEAVALFFVGTLCPQLERAQEWQQQGWQIVQQEMERQVRSDGLHFEQSAYYHVYALDFFLHAGILAKRNGIEVPPAFDAKLERMFDALYLLSRSGPPPSFGDDDGGRLFDGQRNRTEHLLDPFAAGAVLFRRPEFKWLAGDVREELLWLLGQKAIEQFDALSSAPAVKESQALPESGVFVMADDGGNQQIVIDAGPLGSGSGGHAHADALSVWANENGRPLLIDSGTLEYVGDGAERNLYRGTAAHNTLTVDGLDQAEARGPFGWKEPTRSKAELWINGKGFDLFAGSHEGYLRLPDPVLHRRWAFSLKSHFWLVRDVIEGKGRHSLDLRWHVATRLIQQGNSLSFTALADNAGISFLYDERTDWSADVAPVSWSPVYGRREAATVVSFRASKALPTEFVTLLAPFGAAKRSQGSLAKVVEQSSAACWRYLQEDQEHWMIFAAGGKPWSFGRWSSDAEFLYFGESEPGQRMLILCNGSYVANEGVRIVTCPQAIVRLELTEKNGHVEMVASGEQAVAYTDSLGGLHGGPAGIAQKSASIHEVNR